MDASIVRPESSSAENAMSSAEKGRAAAEKREARVSSGGGRKEEKKKRKLILSDSESGGDDFVISHHGGSSDRTVGDRNGVGEDDGGGKKVWDGSGGGEKREPEVSASEAVSGRGGCDGGGKKVLDGSGGGEKREQEVSALEAVSGKGGCDGGGKKVLDGSGGGEEREPEVSASEGGGCDGGGKKVLDGPGGGEKRELEVLASEAVSGRGGCDGGGKKVLDGSGGGEKREQEVSASEAVSGRGGCDGGGKKVLDGSGGREKGEPEDSASEAVSAGCDGGGKKVLDGSGGGENLEAVSGRGGCDGGGKKVLDGSGGREKREPEVSASVAASGRGGCDDGGKKVLDGSGGGEKREPKVSASEAVSGRGGCDGGNNGASVVKKDVKCWLALERERRMRDAAAGLKISSGGSGARRNKIDPRVKEKETHAERKTASRSNVVDKGGGEVGGSLKRTPSASEAKRASKSEVKPIRKVRKLEENRVSGPEVLKKKEAGDGNKGVHSGAAKRVLRPDTKVEGGSWKSTPTTSNVRQDGDQNCVSKSEVAKGRLDVDWDKKVLDVSGAALSGKSSSVEKVLDPSGDEDTRELEVSVAKAFAEKREAHGANIGASVEKQDSKKCHDDLGAHRNGESGDSLNREEMNVDEKMVSSSDHVGKREGGESDSCKKTPSAKEVGEGAGYKESPSSSEVNGKDSFVKKKTISEFGLASKKERNLEVKRVSILEVGKKVKKGSKIQAGDENEDADQNGINSPNKKKHCRDGLSKEAKRVSRPEAKKEPGSCKKASEVTTERVDVGGDKEIQYVSGRKRNRETVETETRGKKIKSEDEEDVKNSPDTEKVGWIERSGARTLRKLKDKVLSTGKKVHRFEKGHIHSGHEQNKKRVPKHPSISVEGKVTVKTNLKKGRAEHKTKEECEPKFETCLPAEQNVDEAASGKVRLTDKQKIREQIKKILLDAGWEIDLRPRRGRDYMDAVYIPPFGGAGYWSVTKAYSVYLEKCKSENEEKNKDLPESSALPTNLVSMLKRNVINKRRKMIEKDENQEKLGARKKGKGFISKKNSKNKQSKSEGRVIKKVDRGELRKKATEMANISSAAEKPHLRARNQNQRGCALLVRGSDQDVETDVDDYIPYAWKRTTFSWMIDLGILHANGKVKYMNEDKTLEMLEGWITRDGIRCSCCSKIITMSKFEIHADSKLCQPYQNIYVEDTGISLLQCLLNAWEKERSEHLGFHRINIEGDDPNDDTCGLCGDGGDLICCDRCPSTFHLNCLGIERLPSGDWHCTNCSCKFCGLVSDPTSEGSSTISSLLACSQCERKFHQECIPEKDRVPGHDISGTSFCGQSCCMVYKQLQKLLGIKNDLEAGLSWRLIRHLDKDSSEHQICLPQWAECNCKSAVAFAVMDECFLPIIDQRSGINLIHNIVYNYGSNISRLSYNGFYTFILEREDEIIAAASVRIHGTTLAEMPFIGTRNMYRRQGMCRQLLKGIELALYSLDVEKLIIPAISELKETWVNVFGFVPLEQSQKQEIRSINMLVFPGTGLLLKPIPKKESVEHNGNAGRADQDEPVINHLMIETDNEAYVQSSLCSPDEVVYSKHEVKDVNIVVPQTENFGVSHESEFQDPKSKSSEAAAEVALSVQTEVVYHDELMADDEFQITSSKEPKVAAPCVGTVHADHNVDSEDAAVADGISVRQSTKDGSRQSLLAGNGSPVLSSFESNLASDEEVIVNPEQEIKVLEHKRDDFPNAHKSECQPSDCKSSETAFIKLSAEPDMVSNSEPAGRDVFLD